MFISCLLCHAANSIAEMLVKHVHKGPQMSPDVSRTCRGKWWKVKVLKATGEMTSQCFIDVHSEFIWIYDASYLSDVEISIEPAEMCCHRPFHLFPSFSCRPVDLSTCRGSPKASVSSLTWSLSHAARSSAARSGSESGSEKPLQSGYSMVFDGIHDADNSLVLECQNVKRKLKHSLRKFKDV